MVLLDFSVYLPASSELGVLRDKLRIIKKNKKLTALKKYVIEYIDEKRLFDRRQFYYKKSITSSRTSSST